jgi:hypothetical protein
MAWETIANAEIAVDADVDSSTFVKYRDRDQYLRDVMEGSDPDKIVAQALQVYSAGAGDGLTIDSFNWIAASGTTGSITGNGTTTVTTGLTATDSRYFLPTIRATTTGGGITNLYRYSLYVAGASNALTLEIVTSAHNTNQTIAWRVVGIART